jgi:hypothetical protein
MSTVDSVGATLVTLARQGDGNQEKGICHVAKIELLREQRQAQGNRRGNNRETVA